MAPRPAPRPLARRFPRALIGCALLLSLALAAPAWLGAEGSATLYPATSASPFRANLEWRTTFYGSADSPDFNIFRRTLIKVYAEKGEHLLLASSGVDVTGEPDKGDIRVFNPGSVKGLIGSETIPELSGESVPPQPGAFTNGFSCLRQREAAGNESRGRIGSRAQELAGPNTENNLLPAGYRPCIYTAPVSGIYDVIFTGPSGESANENAEITGQMNPTADDFGPKQYTSVTAWDVSVRRDLNNPAVESGRAFTYYFTGNTGDGGREISSSGIVVTDFGFTYKVRYAGDPYGFIVYSNQYGFQDSDGSPLYRNLMADPSAPTQDQNELKELQGGVRLLPPKYPIFFDIPYGPALDALGIPREPIIPSIARLTFSGTQQDNSSYVGEGGTFTFQTTQPGVYTVVISRDGQDFRPDNPRNRLIRGVAEKAGNVTVRWNGRANNRELFPVGDYSGRAIVQGGEVHFPFLDVENNLPGGPVIELLTPPDANDDGVGDCPPWNGGCFGAFYDDSGYYTADGTLVGTAPDAPLCSDSVGRPPRVLKSDPLLGYDTRTNQRAFGFPHDANPETICSPRGGYGDKKALDLWTFYPSNELVVPLRIVDRTAVTLRSFSAAPAADGVEVSWETGSEIGSAGFHLLRAPNGDRSAATRVTPSLILARGSTTEGASYSWLDTSAEPGVRYTYWLEEHERGGRVIEYGPAVTPAVAAGPFRVALPLVRQ